MRVRMPTGARVEPVVHLPHRPLCWIAVALFVATLSGCGDPYGLCANDALLRVPSPSRSMDAVVFMRDCGATTGFNTQVSVVPAGGQSIDGGDTLVLEGRVPIRLEWRSDTQLVVSGIGSARVFHRAIETGGISISYE